MGVWAEVDEVFRGPQADAVVGLREQTNLGLFSSAVWLLLPDGTVGALAPEPPAATA